MTQIGGLPGQLVQGGTYLVSSAMDSDGQHITHTTRASPATVSVIKWLCWCRISSVYIYFYI